MLEKAVYFVAADDDFIAANRAREIYEELSADVFDDMSKEIIDGSANKTDDAVEACRKTREASATLSLFGGKKVVWLRGVNFINDSRAGKSQDTKDALEILGEFLSTLNPESAQVVISASPVDRRKKFFKDIQKFAEFEDFQSKDPISACVELLQKEAKRRKVILPNSAAETLAGIVAGNPRMAIQELEKLSVYVGDSKQIDLSDVIDMVPIFGEGDFFDIASAFFARDLNAGLSALRRYFFANKNASARPIISSLQKQNSLLIQLRALMESGDLLKSTNQQPRGAVENAAGRYTEAFAGAEDKSSYNVFSQNAWYAGAKLAPIAAGNSLKDLIDFQMNFIKAFEELISRGSNADEAVMRDLFIKSIGS